MQQLTQSMFDDLWPKAAPGLVAAILANQATAFPIGEVNTDLRLVHFMAQASEECASGTKLVEDLDYSAQRLVAVWPMRFPTLQNAEAFAHNPKALADRVYGGRMGNRLMTDDGYIYRGRGALQATGRDKYASVGALLGLDLVTNPDLILDNRYTLSAACAVWKLAGANAGADADSLSRVTRAINGGLNGLPERRDRLAKWKDWLGL